MCSSYTRLSALSGVRQMPFQVTCVSYLYQNVSGTWETSNEYLLNSWSDKHYFRGVEFKYECFESGRGAEKENGKLCRESESNLNSNHRLVFTRGREKKLKEQRTTGLSYYSIGWAERWLCKPWVVCKNETEKRCGENQAREVIHVKTQHTCWNVDFHEHKSSKNPQLGSPLALHTLI